MANAARFIMVFVVTLVLSSVTSAQPPIAPPPHLALGEFVKEYKRYGLPFPPANAQLVRIDWYLYREPRPEPPLENPYVLAWRVPPAKPGDRPHYVVLRDSGFGFEEVEYVEPAAMEEAKPTPDAARLLAHQYGGHFLILAIQCKERGWDDLAGALYSPAREWLGEEESRPPTLDDLRDVADMYWYGQITSRTGDRKEALRRLTAMAAEDGPPDPITDRYLRDLALTVAPRKSKPGSVEALIDDLTEYWAPQFFSSYPSNHASYWKLAELGFDAVPALIEHVGDNRLTRTTDHGPHFASWHDVTVGHLCSRLLFDLSARTIGGRYRQHAGDRLDPVEARKWFEKAKKIGEEKWLLDHAILTDDDAMILNQKGRPEPLIVRVIGAKYPERLPAIYRAMLKQPVEGVWLNDYVNEIVLSKLPREQKVALLEEGAVHDDLDHRILALEGLAKLDQASLRKHLSTTLKMIQKRKPEALPEDRLLRLVESADDRACWDALLSVAKAADIVGRWSFIFYICPMGPPDRNDPHRLERIRFLVQFLDDDEVRDDAATSLAGLLGFPVRRHIVIYYTAHDTDRGPLTRLLFREAMRHFAARELAGK